jgi:hypothetical protein
MERAILLESNVPMTKRGLAFDEKAEPMTIPNCMNVASNNVLTKNLRRIGPISFARLDNSFKFSQMVLREVELVIEVCLVKMTLLKDNPPSFAIPNA